LSNERIREKRNSFVGTEGSTDRRLTGEGVRVTGVTYQCSSPANTGEGAYGIRSPDPNIHSPLNASKKAKKQNNESQ